MGTKKLLSALALGAIVTAGPVGAAQWKEVSAAEVKTMMDAGGVTVVNPLSRIEFNDLHIPGSVNIAPHELEAKLPPDKGAALVFYCLGMKCVAAPEASSLAVSLGYTNVHCFRGGLPEWIQAGYPVESTEKLPKVDVPDVSPAELKALLEGDAGVVLLDIRSASEVAKYRIASPARLHIPLEELVDRVGELPAGRRVVVLDVNGRRAPLAGRYLLARGVADVAKLPGGMERWLKDGMPVDTSLQ